MEVSQEQKALVIKMIKRKIEIECEKKPREEVCGFVVHDGENFDVIPIENKAINKENEFYIPAKEFLFIKEKHNLVAIYHSHIEGPAEESEFDVASSEVCCYPFVIYSMQTNRFGTYVPEYLDCNVELLNQLKKELA